MDEKVYKLIGSLLIEQEHCEVKSIVQKRISLLEKEMEQKEKAGV